MSKWKAGAKKHGGLLKAALVQINKWEQSAEEQAKEAREAEELRQRLENERLAKEAEELRQRLENERLAKEAEERERLVQEQLREVLELSKKEAEELEQLKLAEKLSKESFEKSQRDKIWDFLSRSEDVSDEAAFPAMDIVKKWESTNTELIEKLRSFEDPVLNSFLDGEVGIVGGDSSF
ncbi:hypothetical protein Megpolyxen_01366 [Candidatus Megaera polyxenophila]|nr:hypothetical protein Megpolyxen_01366 [Candidatus Megaera polyxenophila]